MIFFARKAKIRGRLSPQDELKELSQFQGRFLSNINHELRNPINGILGMLWLLDETNLDHEQKHYVSNLRHSTDALLRLMDDMVDLSRLQIGTVKIKPRVFDLESVIEKVAGFHTAISLSRNLTMEWVITPVIPKKLIADPDRCAQILGNFLLVAIKFSSKSVLHVTVDFKSEGENSFLRFEICNMTHDFANDALVRLRAMLEQTSLDLQHKHGTLGISLAFCQSLSREWGGRMGIGDGKCSKAGLWMEVPVQMNDSNQP